MPPRRLLLASLLLALALVVGAWSRPAPHGRAAAGLAVHVLDVGQGDAILLDLGETEVLIDGGRDGAAAAALADRVDGPLEVVVATHPDADHIGGLDEVLAQQQVLAVWVNGAACGTRACAAFDAAVRAEGAALGVARRGGVITAGELRLQVLHPLALTGADNDDSIVLALTYGARTFLFTGDLEATGEAALLAAGLVPDVDVLKVGHHGSRDATSAAFLAAARPAVAVYSAGADNPYGHPHRETLERLAAAGAAVYGTPTHGTVTIWTDGTSCRVEPARGEPALCVAPGSLAHGAVAPGVAR